MNGVSELLSEMAEHARTYGTVEPALRVLRRRRRVARLAPLTVAAAVVVALVVAYAAVGRGPLDRTIGDPRPLPWLPETFTVPTQRSPALPIDRGVGPGAFVVMVADPTTWPAGDSHASYLVTIDGGQYRLPAGTTQYHLSPDGRWLLTIAADRSVLRDLTGTEAKDLGRHDGGSFELAWSSQSAILAVQQTFGADGRPDLEAAATVVELASGVTHTVALTRYPGEVICGVRPDGDLLLCPWDPVAGHVSVRLVDGRTGSQRSHLDVDLSATWADQHLADAWMPVPGAAALANGDNIMVGARRPTAVDGGRLRANGSNGLLILDRRDGRVLRWIDLPENQPMPQVWKGDTLRFLVAEHWNVGAVLPEGVLLVHLGPLAGDARFQALLGLELLDPISGSRTEVMSGSRSTFVVHIVMRGGAQVVGKSAD